MANVQLDKQVSVCRTVRPSSPRNHPISSLLTCLIATRRRQKQVRTTAYSAGYRTGERKVDERSYMPLKVIAVALVAVAVGAYFGYRAGYGSAEETTWTEARTQAWRVRAGGACDAALYSVVELSLAVDPSKYQGLGLTYEDWLVLAHKLGEQPEVYSGDVEASLPKGAVIGWVAGLAHPKESADARVVEAFKEAGISLSANWAGHSVQQSIEAADRLPDLLYRGLCNSEFAMTPHQMG